MSLHHMLAEAEIKLRNAKDDHDRAKAFAEDRASVDGKNAEERARKLTIAIAQNEVYQNALRTLRGAEAAVAKLKADLAVEEDERRAREWEIRARLVEALSFTGVQTDSKAPISDRAFDDVADANSLARLEANLRSGYQNKPVTSFEEYAQRKGFRKDGSAGWVKDTAELPF